MERLKERNIRDEGEALCGRLPPRAAWVDWSGKIRRGNIYCIWCWIMRAGLFKFKNRTFPFDFSSH